MRHCSASLTGVPAMPSERAILLALRNGAVGTWSTRSVHHGLQNCRGDQNEVVVLQTWRTQPYSAHFRC